MKNYEVVAFVDFGKSAKGVTVSAQSMRLAAKKVDDLNLIPGHVGRYTVTCGKLTKSFGWEEVL